MSIKRLGLSLLCGLALSLCLYSSLIAMLYDWHPSLGNPPLWPLYNPLVAIDWWQCCSNRPAVRETMQLAAVLSVVPASLPLLLAALPSRMKPGESNKDSGLGTVKDLKATGYISTDPGRLVLGDGGHGRVLSVHGDKHLIVLGPSGGGKDVRHVIPSLLLDSGSALIFDPKRELDGITGRRRRDFGKVHVLDLADPRQGSASFNPFDTIRKGFEIEDSAMMAHLIAYQNGDDDRGGRAGPWNAATAKMATAGFLHVNASDDRTLAHFRRWVEAVIEGKYPEPKHDFAARAILAHEALPDETKGGVNFNLDAATAFIGMGESVAKATSQSTFDPADLMCGYDPVTVYLTIPPSHRQSLRSLQRLVLTMLANPLKHDKLRAADGRQKVRPMTLHASEFTTMGKLDLFATGMKDLRGYGFRYVISTQGVEDIKDVYGENNPIMLNCQVIVAIPGFGEKTNKYLVETAGKHWVMTKGRSRKPGLFSFPTNSESEHQVPILDIGRMQERGLEESLVLARGVKPVWVDAAPYYEHPAFRRMYDNEKGSELLRL